MNIASSLRLCALPLAVSLALSACSGSSTPPDGQKAAEPRAATTTAETALPAGWQRVAGAEMPAVHDQKAVLPAKVHSDDGADIEVTDTRRIIAGGDDVIAVIEALGLGKQVFAAPTNTTTQAGLAAPHQFLFNRTTGVEGVLSLQGSLFLGNSLRRHTELAKKLREVGEPAVVIDDLQPAPDKVRKVAAALGLAEAGQTIATQVQRQLDEAAAIGKGLGHAPRLIHVSATGAG
ncbi:TPA: hemin ABC transporter substrate-binding protein, partial [Stenotrophomonas maltophilia]|nr:hemin ABC transporter substrate-binding protein [Stenotrophomonas maltophilia]